MINPHVADLLHEAGLSAAGVSSATVVGADPIVPSKFRLGEVSATALAACGVAAANLWQLKSGRRQDVSVEVRAAAISLAGYRTLRFADRPDWRPGTSEGPLVTHHRCRDGRWIMIHGRLPNLAEGTKRVLGLTGDPDHETVARAVAGWDSQDLEDALAAGRQCGGIHRSADEWLAHPQGAFVAAQPRVEIVKIGDSDPIPLPPGDQPLAGIRTLDLTRILAGPACARTLAHFGADVLHITSPNLPFVEQFIMDTNHGKRAAHLDLETSDGLDALRRLTSDADVFVQGYRAGSLARRGFGPDQLAREKPGIVYTSINAYGHGGPWEARPGWEQLAQTVSGMTMIEGAVDRPQLQWAPANDYTTGYLAALGTMAALHRRATVGGSYHVRASLCQTAAWYLREGHPFERDAIAAPTEFDDLYEQTDTAWGPLRHLAPAVQMSETPARWSLPVVPLGTHRAEWAPHRPGVAARSR